MKKILSIFLLSLLSIFYSVQVYANNTNGTSTDDSVDISQQISFANIAEAEAYAYLDYETASAEEKVVIIQAREYIIWQSSWSADGVTAFLTSPDGTVTYLPYFHDIFPDDWDIPEMPTDDKLPADNEEASLPPPQRSDGVYPYYDGLTYFSIPGNVNSNPFCNNIYTSGYMGYDMYEIDQITTFAVFAPGYSYTYNCGYTNYNTNASIAWSTYIPQQTTFSISPASNIRVAVRGSSYDMPGSWYVTVNAQYSYV